MGKKERFFYEITSLNPEVTGSCHLVTVHYPDARITNFAVDFGSYQEELYNELNAEKIPFECDKIQFVLITHNHADHMGRLPYLIKGGYKGKIFCTQETAQLMPIALKDSYKIEHENAQRDSRKPLYDETDLEETISRITPCKFGEVEYLDRNIKATFYMNGHLYGASMILLQISFPGEEDINLLFTGDYKPENQLFEVTDMPSWVYKLPMVVVTESTYGYMDTTEVKYHMEDDIEKAIKEGKTILISVFAQGRAQEVLYLLKSMQYFRRLSTKIPIWLDGKLAQEYTRLYRSSKMLLKFNKADFLPENFGYVNQENRQAVLQSKEQQIILCTSGMLDHGPAKIYLESFVERSDVLIYIPGYTSPKTLGYRLQKPVNGFVTINGKKLVMRAQVETTKECSSHAKADEIIEFLERFKHLILVLINHGQKEVKEKFAERVQKEVTNAKRVEILGEHTFRISPYGYIKQMGSKIIFLKSNKKEEEDKKKTKIHKKEKNDKHNKQLPKFTKRVCYSYN